MRNKNTGKVIALASVFALGLAAIPHTVIAGEEVGKRGSMSERGALQRAGQIAKRARSQIALPGKVALAKAMLPLTNGKRPRGKGRRRKVGDQPEEIRAWDQARLKVQVLLELLQGREAISLLHGLQNILADRVLRIEKIIMQKDQ